MCSGNKLMYYHLKNIVIVINDIIGKSREQTLITKEHIATHTNSVLLFKPALYSSTLVIKFNSSIKPKFLL